MKPHALHLPALLRTALLGLAIGTVAWTASAQPTGTPPAATAATAQATEAEPAHVPLRRPVGDATRDLLALQREGRAASPTPRPIAGEVADLSYQRYLKSFTHPIPADFKSSIGQQGSRSK